MHVLCEPYLKISSFRKLVITSRKLLLDFSVRWGLKFVQYMGSLFLGFIKLNVT